MKIIKKHLISAITFGFFLFIAFGSDENTDNTDNTFWDNEPETKMEQPVQDNDYSTSPEPETEQPIIDETEIAENIERNRTTFIENINKCINISEQIAESDNDSLINILKEEAVQSQVKAWDALLDIQMPESNYLYEQAQSGKSTTISRPEFYSREKIKMMSAIYQIIGKIYADQRVLNLSTQDFKNKVIDELTSIESLKPKLENL